MKTRIISRAEAKAKGLKRYFTGKKCPYGHVAERWVSGGACAECLAERVRANQKRMREEEPERVKKAKAEHYERRKEHIKARVKRNYHADIEKSRAAARKYVEEHREEARVRVKAWVAANTERKRAADRTYNALNRATVNAAKAKYRATKRKATPPWVDKAHLDKIRKIYKEAERMSVMMNEPYHVDHIVPLQGGTVCGLHVWWNLRVIRGEDNNKRRRIWTDGPDGIHVHIK